jgi:hypothetical protein
MHTTLYNIVVISILIVDDFLVYNVKFVLLKACGYENLREFFYQIFQKNLQKIFDCRNYVEAK